MKVSDAIKIPLATSTKALFKNCMSLERIFDDIILSQSKNVSQIFYQCHNLKEIRKLDAPRAENWTEAFAECTNLTAIGNLDMSHATSCTSIFTGCSNLMYVGINNLNTSISFVRTKLTIESLRYIIKHLKRNSTGTIDITGTPAAIAITLEDEAILDGTTWMIVH